MSGSECGVSEERGRDGGEREVRTEKTKLTEMTMENGESDQMRSEKRDSRDR